MQPFKADATLQQHRTRTCIPLSRGTRCALGRSAFVNAAAQVHVQLVGRLQAAARTLGAPGPRQAGHAAFWAVVGLLSAVIALCLLLALRCAP